MNNIVMESSTDSNMWLHFFIAAAKVRHFAYCAKNQALIIKKTMRHAQELFTNKVYLLIHHFAVQNLEGVQVNTLVQ